MLVEAQSLGEIPHGALGAVSGPTPQNGSPGVLVSVLVRPLPDVSYQVADPEGTVTIGVTSNVVWHDWGPAGVG